MPAKRRWSTEQLEQLRNDFHSDLINTEVGKKYGCDYNRSIKKFWVEWFGEEEVKNRFKRNCATSRLGELNPMFRKFQSKHPRWVPSYMTSNGYVMIDCPDWWEGPCKAGKYLAHNIIGCEKYKLTKLPPKHVIHHIDDDKTNNDPSNLQLMSMSDHMKHHSRERASKVQRLSRKGVEPKRARSAPLPEKEDDIV